MSPPTISCPADLKDQVVRLWTVVYHSDQDCIYTFFDWQRVMAGVEGSLRTYLDEGAETEEIVRNLMVNLREWADRSSVPICLTTTDGNHFTIDIYRWEIDRHSALSTALYRCYEQVDDQTKMLIMGLFSNPR